MKAITLAQFTRAMMTAATFKPIEHYTIANRSQATCYVLLLYLPLLSDKTRQLLSSDVYGMIQQTEHLCLSQTKANILSA